MAVLQFLQVLSFLMVTPREIDVMFKQLIKILNITINPRTSVLKSTFGISFCDIYSKLSVHNIKTLI